MNLREAITERGTSTLCVSLSSNPGTFGTTVHNAGFAALDIDYKYVACLENDIGRAMLQVRNYGVRGASISMPHKISVIKLLDELDDSAVKTGAVNTVVNTGGRLKGYNTDIAGFSALAKLAELQQDEPIIVIGSGGAARAVLEALKGYNVTIWSRNVKARKELAKKYRFKQSSCKWLEWTEGTVVNCTPIGMSDEPLPIVLEGLSKAIDIIVKETPFVKAAKALNIPAFSGSTMALYGAAEQFKLYTGIDAPIDVMQEALGDKA